MVTRKQFLQALRSGKYEQGTERLRTGGSYIDRYCCLGLFCELSAPLQWGDAANPSFSLYAESANAIDNRYALRDFGHTLGMHEDTPLEVLFKIQVHMIHMNDGIGDFEGNAHSFVQIADWIDNDLEAFVEEAFGEIRFTRA